MATSVVVLGKEGEMNRPGEEGDIASLAFPFEEEGLASTPLGGDTPPVKELAFEPLRPGKEVEVVDGTLSRPIVSLVSISGV